jgi:hypothetical protein
MHLHDYHQRNGTDNWRSLAPVHDVEESTKLCVSTAHQIEVSFI